MPLLYIRPGGCCTKRCGRPPAGGLGVSPNSNPPTSPFVKGGQEGVSGTKGIEKKVVQQYQRSMFFLSSCKTPIHFIIVALPNEMNFKDIPFNAVNNPILSHISAAISFGASM